MTFDTKSLEAIFLLLAFVAPGFLLITVRNYFVVRRPLTTPDRALTYLTASAVNYAFFSWLVYLLLSKPYDPLLFAVGWFTVLFIGPVAIGLLWAVFSQRGWLRRILGRIGLQPVHVIPTAWDWKFGQIREEAFLLVTLKNGEKFAGLYGYQSFASSTPGERDIFLEQLYEIGEDEQWRQATAGKGALIDYAEVAYIEFWSEQNLDKVGTNEQDRTEDVTNAE